MTQLPAPAPLDAAHLASAFRASGISVKVSPSFDAYAAGELDASQIICALCQLAPCQCPEFGTPAYFALIGARHGPARPQAGG